MLFQKRDNFLPAFLPALGSRFRVFGRSPALNRFSGGEEHCDTSVQSNGNRKQKGGSHYYNAGWIGGQAGQEAQCRPPQANRALVERNRDPHAGAD